MAARHYEEEYLPKLRATMSDPAEARVTRCAHCGYRSRSRLWPGGRHAGDDNGILRAMLDGLCELATSDRTFTVFGLWLLDPGDDPAADMEVGKLIELWQVHDRHVIPECCWLVTTGTYLDVIDAMAAHPCPSFN